MKLGLAAIVCLSLMFRANIVAAQTQGELSRAESDGKDWLYVDHDYAGTRYSSLRQITPANAADLTKVCSFVFPEKETAQSSPVARNGILFVSSATYTAALDGTSCKAVWMNKWPAKFQNGGTQRGVAIGDGKVIRGTPDGYLIALDAMNGKLVWSREIAHGVNYFGFPMPTMIYDGLVFIGPAGAELAVKGWIGAFRLRDGKPVWKFDTVPAPGEPGAETWGPNPTSLKFGGGTVWTPLSLDIRNRLLYVPVGNPAPDNFGAGRPGANLYTNALVALDPRNGKLAWYVQVIAHDERDYDLTHVAPMFSATVGGRVAQLVALTGKDGILRVLDRDTHGLVYAVPFSKQKNAEGELPARGLHVCPGMLGGEVWSGAAFSPALGSLFVPGTDWCNTLKPDETAPKPQPGKVMFMGGTFAFDAPKTASGSLTAFDAATGALRWRYASPRPMIGGVVATAGGLVFAGELTGRLLAFDAANGKSLARLSVEGPIAGGVLSYGVGEKQYVAVESGSSGDLFAKTEGLPGEQRPTITVFALKNR